MAVTLPFVIANGAAGPYPGANFDANFNALLAGINGIGTNPGIPWAVAGGSADAITVIYSSAIAALTDGLTLQFRASAANATTTPTFSPNGLPAHPITKYGGSAGRSGSSGRGSAMNATWYGCTRPAATFIV